MATRQKRAGTLPQMIFVNTFILNGNLFLLSYLPRSSNRHGSYHTVLELGSEALMCLEPRPTSSEKKHCE